MGALTKDRLIFDPSDSADSDNIGAYLRAGSDGDLLSSTNVSGKEGLDINIINASVTVTATDFDIRDLTHVSDSVKVGDGTDFLGINSDGSIISRISDGTDTLAVNADGSINSVVSATDLDIRDLTHVSDSVKVGDGTDFLSVNADGSINVNLTDDGVADDAADSGNPLKVGGKAYASLSADPVDDGDRANLAQDIYRRVYIHDGAHMSVASAKVTVGATAVALPTSALAGRTRIMIQNISSNPVWIGPSGVTTSGATTGILVSKSSTLSLEAGENVALYAIAAGAGNDVVVFEMA